MPRKSESVVGPVSTTVIDRRPRSLVLAVRGVKTARELATFMTLLIPDLIEGRISPSVGNAVCNAVSKLLRVTELQTRHGMTATAAGERIMYLSE